MSDEFKAQFKKSYGRYQREPDYNRCAAAVTPQDSIWAGSKQCSRKNGHGPHGAWCKQHDPVAVKAKDEARRAAWRAEWDRKDRARKFQAECIEAIRKIAAGHNDPRGLAQSILDEAERDR